MRYSTLLKLPILLLFALVLFSCEKESEPTVPELTTVEPTSITGLTAVSGGNITSEGRGKVTAPLLLRDCIALLKHLQLLFPTNVV